MHRWVGDATKVQALAKTVVKTRMHGETGEPAHVQIPDHLDVLAELACGAQAHIVMSEVTGNQSHGHRAEQLCWITRNWTSTIVL